MLYLTNLLLGKDKAGKSSTRKNNSKKTKHTAVVSTTLPIPPTQDLTPNIITPAAPSPSKSSSVLPLPPQFKGTILGAPTPSSTPVATSLPTTTPLPFSPLPTPTHNKVNSTAPHSSPPTSPASTIQPLLRSITLGPVSTSSASKKTTSKKNIIKSKKRNGGDNIQPKKQEDENNEGEEEDTVGKKEEDEKQEQSNKDPNNMKCSITQTLLGSYRWGEKHIIYVPGCPVRSPLILLSPLRSSLSFLSVLFLSLY